MPKEWDVQSARDKKDSVVKDTQLDKLIFSDKLEDYRQFIKFILNKVNNERT